MNKGALKKFATEARRELLERVELQARKIGITKDLIQTANVESSDAVFIDGIHLSHVERKQRNKLIARIDEIGFERVMDETAYTWFNRLVALRFMEVNEYLPTKVRVLSSSNEESVEPDMMREALSLDLEVDKKLVYELKMNNDTDGLFKYLIKVHCNDLNRYMPFMFESIEDYKEILFPEGLLGTDSFVRKMTNYEVIAEEDWKKVEIIGWLYQYYISEENERVIKAKKRYKAEELPYATQLFTPEWIVRYMVQNALGRYWIESHPEQKELLQNWEFFLESQDSHFEEKIEPYINKNLSVEEIKCFDPAMGSGHILVYMFDVLYEIYIKCGYMEREIPRLIIENNLYGLDIDDRAYQLASFSVVMKALQYNKRFLRNIEREGLVMNLTAIQETNVLIDEDIVFLSGESSGESYEKMKLFITQFQHAKAIGSLLKLEEFDYHYLIGRLKNLQEQTGDLFEIEKKERNLPLYESLITQAVLMNTQYDVFVTNPPYAGSKYVTPEVATYLNTNYPDVKSDLFSAFIEYSFEVTKKHGQIGFMTPFVWMFISSYEKLRNKIVKNKNISTLVQLEYSGFEGATVPICTFTLKNYRVDINGEYIKLSDFRGASNQSIKALEAVKYPEVSYRYSFQQFNFSKIPGHPIAFWTSNQLLKVFSESKNIASISSPRLGMATASNEQFLRFWHEVEWQKIKLSARLREEALVSKCKWFPYNKGGEYRKWYGNNEYVVNWENDGEKIRNFTDAKGKVRSHNYNLEYIFKPGITWSALSSGKFSSRFFNSGFLFDNSGSSLFIDNENIDELYIILGYLSSKIVEVIFPLINPTLNYQPGTIGSLPIKEWNNKDLIVDLVKENIRISKDNWDLEETSWDFKMNPLLMLRKDDLRIESAFNAWQIILEHNINKLVFNEERLNEIFIEMYDLQKEISPKIEKQGVTIFNSKSERDTKKFLSYAIGCMYGRYSLDEEGLIYAGGEFNFSRYQIFPADQDNIIPILPEAYFEDDIVTKVIDFVRVTFSEETLEDNLSFIADALGRKSNETSRETLRRYFLNDFYKDHIQTYKKRPIYWLFTSGKEKAFNCLIYMHRYDKTTLSRIRTDYLHEVQNRMDAEKKDLLAVIEGDSTTKEISNSKKMLKSLDKKIDELKAYDELLHHMADQQIEIDLDDGVKVNYEKFKGLVAKIN
ncbi:BREX-1 system adenine-specific DNA-methyltransferase PglX [Exiguobacterium sp. SH3S1]|uniref:BREX-1 system adenine-specific DNA-methyltransferase PglX n=1 Tax=Exiguobacterium sp. SH3S1 TaxID=2510955 RepID=UPI001038A123|nr:BREX-1 system adenine-specific DNA-methyltransferase PglX [Exiguobacterium sp. SH3S1]TCI61816.1 BREX-1 system adenine-specific DNA-methyltransferase PglX [Exiguobacterium sp. SH3S1]